MGGICYPRLERIAAVANRSRTWAFEKARDLERWGYLRRLVSKSKKKRHAVRRQVKWTRDWPKPPKEREEERPDRTLRARPWMFSDSTPTGGNEMASPVIREMREPITQDEIARRQHEGEMRDRERLQGATLVSRHFADAVGRATGEGPSPNFSFLTARKWLMKGFSEKECCAHIDPLMAEMKGKAAWEYPFSLADWRAPERAA